MDAFGLGFDLFCTGAEFEISELKWYELSRPGVTICLATTSRCLTWRYLVRESGKSGIFLPHLLVIIRVEISFSAFSCKPNTARLSRPYLLVLVLCN
jgi:hypothetical protein